MDTATPYKIHPAGDFSFDPNMLRMAKLGLQDGPNGYPDPDIVVGDFCSDGFSVRCKRTPSDMASVVNQSNYLMDSDDLDTLGRSAEDPRIRRI